MDELTAILQKANTAYHNGKPIMTDDQYDALVVRWEENSGKKWNEYVGVGATPECGSIVTLPMWMGSMNKVKQEKELQSWKSKWSPDTVIISDKLDGISCLFEWTPVTGTYNVYTRGNGRQGTLITHLTNIVPSLNAIKTIIKDPHKRVKWIHKPDLKYFIRGELVIPRESWIRERETIWTGFANPRNTVAGLVNRKDGSVEHLRRIHFVPFSIDIQSCKSDNWNKMTKDTMFRYLDSLHKIHSDIPCVYRSLIHVSDCTKEKLSAVLSERRSTAPYEIDGIVVWDNSGKHEPNGSGNPEHAFAFKMVLDDQTAETLVTGIEWNVSRTGVWKPVVLIDPVVIGGTTIGRTTGHNARWLIDRGIGVGARILLIRSGDVIPKIQNVISGVTKEHITMPPPGTWKWDDTQTDIIVNGSQGIDIATRANYLVATLNIKGLSKKTLEKYVETHRGDVQSLPKSHLFPLVATKSKWLEVNGIKEKSATNFVERTAESWCEATDVVRLVSLGVLPRGIGIKQIMSLKTYGLLEPILNETESLSSLYSRITQLDGWGETRVKSLLSSIESIRVAWKWSHTNGPSRTATLTEVDKTQLQIERVVEPLLQSCMENIGDRENILMTGFRNKDWQSYFESKGKRLISGLAKKHNRDNTVVLTKGSKDSSKVKKALEVGIPVIRIDSL